MRFADLAEKHTQELAQLETWDNGKPYEQALTAELPLFVRLFHYYAGKIYYVKLEFLLTFGQCTMFTIFNMGLGIFLNSLFRIMQDGQIKFMD